MSKKFNPSFSLVFLFLGFAFLGGSSAVAQTNYFTWNNSTNTWSSTNAWTPTGGPQLSTSTSNTNVAVFASTGAGNNAVVLGSDRTVFGLVFTNGANAYTFSSSGKVLDIMSSSNGASGMGLNNVSGTNQTFNLVVQNSGALGTWNTATGATTTLSGGLNLTTSASTASRNLTLSGAGNWVVGAIGNGGASSTNPALAIGSLNITGTGTTTFSGNNTYDGLTTMNATNGTLTLAGDNSGAAGGVTLTAGTLNINHNNALGTGAISFASGTTINNTGGSAVVNAGNQAWTWTDNLTFGSATNTAANNLNLGTGTATASSSRTISLVGSNTTLGMGAVNITSASSGRTLTANGAGNTLTLGGLTLTANTTSAVTVTLAGTANMGVTGAIVNGQNFSNGVTITGTGTTTFSGANTYTGATEIASGATLLYGANDVTADAGGQMYVNGGTLNIGTYNDTVSSVKVSTGGTLSGTTGRLTAGSFALYGNNTISANLGGSAATLLKSSTDTVTLLSGNNTYGGLTTVSSGTLKLGNSTALGSTAGATGVGSGGFLDLNGQTGVAEALNYTGTGGLLNSAAGTTAVVSGAVDIGSGMTVETVGNITLSGQLTGVSTRNLTKIGAGTLKVTAANSTFAGTNTVNAGTLLVDTGASVATSTSIVNGGLLKVNGAAGAITVNTGGSLGGSGTVGALTLNSGGLLNPGNSPGKLTASAAIVLGGATYNWQISALQGVAGADWDLLSVTGLLDMSGLTSSNPWNLVITADSGFTGWTDSSSYSYAFAEAASVSGFNPTAGTDITSLFNITTSGITSLPNASYNPNGDFKVVVGSANGLTTLNLVAVAVPEPSTGSLMIFGLGGLLLNRLLRRKVS